MAPLPCRRLPVLCSAGATPLGACNPGMAELLRRVVERRRVEAAASDSDDEEWGA